ncbi:head GIN domain-containing protein [Hymenobacter sp. H14-R3]|uniref:head GIN domain-containing protein n=1 Tax=Hymenobacter sp. H14-R3 TaxID=3046308 RepID=UPI0024BB5CB1|nr:head GIN domain-containing protein [Hymenobacter sp. H14-R3]MDJ0367137.1 head GIN domain-containing protein [Hymenobacter sp. H14-R3]
MKKYVVSALLGLLAAAPALAQLEPQARPVEKFHAITVGTGIALELTGGSAQQVQASALTADLRDHIITKVVGGVLSIKYEDLDESERERKDKKLARLDKKLRVTVTADQLTSLLANSGATVTATGPYAAPDFQLDVSSGASLRGEVNVGVLIVRQSSGSAVALSGQAPRFDLRLSSGSTFDGTALQTNRSQIEASSGSTAKLAVREVLMAEATGGANIRYIGSPELTKTVSGGGSVSGK